MRRKIEMLAGGALAVMLAAGALAALPAVAGAESAKVVDDASKYWCGETNTGTHTWGEEVTVEATCGKAGYKGKVCTECDIVQRTESYKATGKHKWKKVTVKAKKCKAGYKGKKCKTCGKVVKAKVLKAKKSHKWKTSENRYYKVGKHNWYPTGDCEHPATRTTSCKVCGKVKKVKVLKAEHTWFTEASTADCQHGGVDTQACLDCRLMRTVSVDKGDHVYDVIEERVTPTCTEPGRTALYRCSACGEKKSNSGKVIKAWGHDWCGGECARCGMKVRNDGDGAGGEHEHSYSNGICSLCGHVDADLHVHDYDNGTCTECGYFNAAEHTHDYSAVKEEAVAATCTEPGKTAVEECACGATRGGEEVAALGHEWFDGFCERCYISYTLIEGNENHVCDFSDNGCCHECGRIDYSVHVCIPDLENAVLHDNGCRTDMRAECWCPQCRHFVKYVTLTGQKGAHVKIWDDTYEVWRCKYCYHIYKDGDTDTPTGGLPGDLKEEWL